MPNLMAVKTRDYKKRPILFLDFEMSGLDVGKHEIIEVAALVVSQPNFEIENSYYTKVLPKHIETADPKALKAIGFKASEWKEGISIKQVLLELSDLAPDCMLAGWAVQNEWDFLNAALEKEKLPYFHTHRLIEVFTLAYQKFRNDPSIKYINLPNVARALGIYIDQHKPDSDIRATYEIFKKLI
jgi:DNA polymerase III epsilon subunit-like protein